MNIGVQMPSIGLSIAEGTIDRWLKKEGDSVVKGDLIVAILTEKVTVEIPAEVSGVLLKILCPAGTKVKVGQTIAIIETAGEKAEEVPKAAGVQYTPLSQEVIQLTERAREGKLARREIQGGTISLTNAGVYGALLATPIIHRPQSAILWMGKVMETPVVREGQIVIRSMMYLCLSYDHRIIMGAQAVRFLQVVKKSLENPYPLLLD